jgi:hypothetical protein
VPEDTTDNTLRTLLALGIRAARVGRLKTARDYLAGVLDLDPDNIPALLWQAWLTRDPYDSLSLLAHALEHEPGNERARAGIRWARKLVTVRTCPPRLRHAGRGGAGTGEQPAAPASRKVAEQPEVRLRALTSASSQDRMQKATKAQRARRRIGLFLALLFVGSLLIAWAGWGFAGSVLGLPALAVARSSVQLPSLSMADAKEPTMALPRAATLGPVATPAATRLRLSPLVTLAATPPTATPETAGQPLASIPTPPAEKWIDVDLATLRLVAYEGATPVLTTTVSTGLPNTPTVRGRYRIYLKLVSTTMAGPGYYLPNVPYAMYFYKSYSLHGTYWHNNFGRPMSHGCVNLPTADARWLFSWTEPTMPEGRHAVTATKDNPGTLVIIH